MHRLDTCQKREQQGLTKRCKSAGRRGALAQGGEGAALPFWPHAAPGGGGCLQTGMILDWLNRIKQRFVHFIAPVCL